MSLERNQERALSNRYHLIELVGTGAMGQVYRAEDKLLGGVIVAIKFLSQTLLNEKMRKRFETEAKISALLGEKTIHIIRVKDYGFDENEVPFYVMEFLEGETLSDLIKFQPLPLERFLKITRQICLGMDSAHKGIQLYGKLCKVVHRDIKPTNITILQDSTLGELVKILDFGIARLVEENQTQTRSFMGTLAYCSPEQMEGKKLDNRSDIYSLGVMMYEMLTLEMPILPENSSFGGWYKAHHDFSPRPFDSHLEFPKELKSIIMQCMAKSASDRPQSVEEILKVIEEVEKSALIFNKRVPHYAEQKTQVNSVKKKQVNSRSSLKEKSDDILKWPADKPIRKIVFPRVIINSLETFTGLWVMLDKQDIFNSKSSIRYNQFLFLNSPHPMILWITVVYNRQHRARWLPCYLDLKTVKGQQVASTLAALGNYKIFFFSLQEPEYCEHITSSTIAPRQCTMMKEWIHLSKTLPDKKQSQVSKKRLKDEFEKLKPKILDKLHQQN